jgi:methionyl-tRNA synthetase
MGSFQQLCEDSELDFDEYWKEDSTTELYHFIGKDILYFHALFWPAMLQHAGFRTPTKLFAHGFLTVNGEKMSKSRGTFITAQSYTEHVKCTDYLRYYYAAKLNGSMEDLDLNLEDFVAKVNSDLIGKYVNIASRSAGFISKRFGGKLATREQISAQGLALIDEFIAARAAIAKSYEARDYSRTLREIMRLADQANEYVNDKAPWVLAKREGQEAALQEACSVSINLFRLLTLYLKPILPMLAAKVEAFLNIAPLQWADAGHILLDHGISPYQHLAKRIEPARIEAMLERNRARQEAPRAEPHSPTRHGEAQQSEHPAIAETIAFDDFAKVDLRVARIVEAEQVEGADKLMKLTLDLGGERRTVFAGIKSAYQPEQLQGRLTVMVANLAPRKMRFGVSEGMVLAAGPGGKDIFIVSPDTGAEPGMKVK